jgi:hypothetical protein
MRRPSDRWPLKPPYTSRYAIPLIPYLRIFFRLFSAFDHLRSTICYNRCNQEERAPGTERNQQLDKEDIT